MKIKSITILESGNGCLKSENALVEIEDGRKFVYSIEFTNTWKDKVDYFDNVKSDFENEYEDTDEFGEEDTGLFLKEELWV